MPATVFAASSNNCSTTVAPGGYTAGSGFLTLAAGGGLLFPSPTGGNYCRVTVIKSGVAYVPFAPLSAYTIFKVTAVLGDVLTIAGTLEGTTDRNYVAGDIVELRVTTGSLSDVHAAVNTLETTPALVASVFGRGGAVAAQAGDYTVAQVAGAAPLAGPALTGVPTAPTATPGTSTTQIATTAFVLANVGGGAVSSVFGRLGAIVAQAGDYTVTQVTGAAPVASPTFLGTPAAPTPTTADNSTTLATTAFVKAQGYLTSNLVTSVFTRTGAVMAQAGDYNVAQVTGAAPVASPALTGVPTAPTAAIGTNTTQLATTAFLQGSVQFGHGICNGRLTLTTGAPVGPDSSGSILYFTPFHGNFLGLYDGVATWNLVSFAETSLAVPANGVYDIFAYNNAGTLALEFGNAWSSTGLGTGAAGVRSQGLVLQDGILVKSGATTRRYLGTISTSSGTTYDILQQRLVWNYYNRVNKKIYSNETAGSWTYASTTWRPANNNANNKSWINLVVGVKEGTIHLAAGVTAGIGAVSTWYSVGIGYDASAAALHDIAQQPTAALAGQLVGFTSLLTHSPDIGLHTYWWLESDSGTCTIYVQAAGGSAASGIVGEFAC